MNGIKQPFYIKYIIFLINVLVVNAVIFESLKIAFFPQNHFAQLTKNPIEYQNRLL